jgi:4'-phosphopantetheinyl transferase EntD
VSSSTQSRQVVGPAAPNPARPSALVESLFPGGVAAAELRAPGDPAQLDPEEALSVARAVPKRVGEFAAGRLCARSALARFGIASFAVRAARDRQPLWPAGLVGSITHTQGFCAAVVGEQARFVGLGLDSENADAVSPDLWPSICIAAELAWIASLPARQRTRAATLVFAAKEAFYKCQYPSTGEWLSFSDLRIVPRERALLEGSFDVEAQRTLQALAPQRAGASYPLRTAYRFHEEFVSVGVALVRGSG